MKQQQSHCVALWSSCVKFVFSSGRKLFSSSTANRSRRLQAPHHECNWLENSTTNIHVCTHTRTHTSIICTMCLSLDYRSIVNALKAIMGRVPFYTVSAWWKSVCIQSSTANRCRKSSNSSDLLSLLFVCILNYRPDLVMFHCLSFASIFSDFLFGFRAGYRSSCCFSCQRPLPGMQKVGFRSPHIVLYTLWST